MDPAQILRDFKATKEFFVGIDSDGCIFDSMEIKHKECFAPMFIKHFELQAVSKYAREVWEFVNLYSKDRGANRFPALSKAIKLLGARPQVQARGVKIRDIKVFPVWVGSRNQLIVKVETDTEIYGLGEAGVSGRELAVAGAVQHFREFLIGQDPLRMGALWQEGAGWLRLAISYSRLIPRGLGIPRSR